MHKTVPIVQHPRRGSLFKESHKMPSPPIAFIGDSIAARFTMEGRSTWDKFYAPLEAGNFGTIGDSTQMLIEKLDKELVAIENTHAIVLIIGATDVRFHIKEKVVFEQIKKIVMLLQGNSRPGVRILILGVLPRGDMDVNASMRETNKLVSQLENGFTVRFVDLESTFQDPKTGKIRSELFSNDKINLSPQGYEVLAENIAPVFEEIIQVD